MTATNTDFPDNPRSGSATIRVVLRDVNDNAPVITSAPSNITLREDVTLNTIIGTVTATDADSGEDGTVLFSIREANSPFGLTSPTSGQLVVVRALDFELAQSYFITVRATDNATANSRLFSETVISVTVTDVNDNAPIFSPVSGEYACRLVELGPIGEECVNVVATDADGTAPFNTVSFRLLGARGFLELNGSRVVTAAPLDRQLGASMSLVVVATDGGGRSTVGTVNVTVLDFNNFAPQFSQQVYAATVREDADGVELLQLNATDADTANTDNSRIGFSIVSGNADGHFAVDPDTGRLTTVSARPLDRERVAAYDLTVRARDFGVPTPHQSDALVRVTVTDFNDNRPVVQSESLSCSLPEDVIGQAVCTRVGATDVDLANSGTVEYQLASGNAAGKFSLDAQTGCVSLEIEPRRPLAFASSHVFCSSATHFRVDLLFCRFVFTRAPLDRENVSSYTLVVQTTDLGINDGFTSLTAANLTTITVTVTDVNDNPPIIFNANERNFTLSEDTPPGTFLFTVETIDADIGLNGVAGHTYRLRGASGVFIINSTGSVFTVEPLDRETIASYTFEVIVSDIGNLQTSNTYFINVSDANDCTPIFGVPE